MTSRASFVADRLHARNEASSAFFPGEADRLASACREMAERFLRGGRLVAFGRHHLVTDAQHVSVEFVHPVLVGKRALPALDLSVGFERWVPAVICADDIVMGFAPPGGDVEVAAVLAGASDLGAQTFALSGDSGDYAIDPPASDPYLHQELIEVLYHTLWETVHVFFEHRERGKEVGDTEFLYPFLGTSKQNTAGVLEQVAASIVAKAAEDERLRAEVANEQSEAIVAVADALRDCAEAGGTLLMFGNGGSATDANDWAFDCAVPLKEFAPMPAISLAMESANATAIANDVGAEAIFLRQLIAQAGPDDVAVAISTSGGSANVILALEEARKRELTSVALLGYDGGEILRRGLADHAVVVRSDYIPRIQEIQASIYHTILEVISEF